MRRLLWLLPIFVCNSNCAHDTSQFDTFLMILFTDFCGFSGSSGPSQSTRSTSDPEPLTGSELSCSDLPLASFSSLSPTVEFTDELFKFESSLAETEARVSDISWGQVSKSQVELTFKIVSKAQTYPMPDTKFMTKLVVGIILPAEAARDAYGKQE
jgi:hypothetical protein